MELPQPSAFGTEARKATHDFLSLYSHSPVPQDPRPSHGRFIKTHNFLQPLETEEKRSPKEDNSIEINIERPPLPVSPPSVERILPGGIGTYSISRISYLNQRVPKPEDPVFTAAPASSNNNDDNSNCSSYSGSAFTMWDESATRKGKTGQENLSNVNLVKEPTAKAGKWPLDRPSQSAFDYRSTFSSPSSSQPATQQKSQSFMEMIESAKGPHSREDDDEEDVMLKKESSSQKGELRSRVDGKGNDQKANTSRSKHSATEQRRRCKINDRFQMLRELIPHSDQKRDKASFLLEVIEYIQFLQEKVLRYEGSYPGWNHEPAKLTPWRNSHRPTESFADQAQRVNGATSSVLMFGARLEEKSTAISLNMPQDSKLPLESNINNTISFKTMDQNSGLINKAVPISTPLQPDIFPPIRNGSMTPSTSRLPSYVNNASTPQVKLWQSRACASDSTGAKDKLKEQDLAVEGGTINISSMYSQGLLNTLTQALQSSGVDLSQANISVQVDIGKRANSRQNAHQPMDMDEIPISSQSHLHGRIESNRGRESDQAHKRLKTG